MTLFYKHVNKKVLKSYKMLVVILILSIWFLANWYLLHKILANKTSIQFKSFLETGAYFIYYRVFDPTFLVLIVIPLFILLLDTVMEFFNNYRIIIRYNNTKTWRKNYYKSIITITTGYVVMLNLLMLVVTLMLNFREKLTFSFILFITKSACFEILGFLIISNVFIILIIHLKNRVASFVIVCTIFILAHFICYYNVFNIIRIPSFEMFMFSRSDNSNFGISDITNSVWFVILFLLSLLLGNTLLDEADLL